MKTVIEQRPDHLPMSVACQALGLNRSSVYARLKRENNETPPKRSRQTAVQPRALSEQERTHVIATLRSVDYRDQAPAEVYQRLLEVSTMHRLLRREGRAIAL